MTSQMKHLGNTLIFSSSGTLGLLHTDTCILSELAFLLELYSGTLMTHLGDSAHPFAVRNSDQAQA